MISALPITKFLDVRHQSAEHIPNVLNQLQTRIGEFISMWPRDAQVKNYRLIRRLVKLYLRSGIRFNKKIA